MKQSIYYILLLNFLIGFGSDLGLNFLSRLSMSPEAIKALKFYFLRKTIKSPVLRDIVSAINAGLTIVAALVITMAISHVLFNFEWPNTIKNLGQFIILAFVIGYAADVLIYKTELFGPTLTPYYKVVGAGLWGALAFIFSIVISYIVLIKSGFKYL